MQQFYNWFFANLNNMLIFINSYDNIFYTRPHGKEVNTSPSHGEVRGSIPLEGTILLNQRKFFDFFYY